jgi:hypothetical protein
LLNDVNIEKISITNIIFPKIVLLTFFNPFCFLNGNYFTLSSYE